MMEWKRLSAGQIVRCKCGRAFFEVAEDSVTWLLPRATGVRIRIPGAALLLCRHQRCRQGYLCVTQPADQANGPPIAA